MPLPPPAFPPDLAARFAPQRILGEGGMGLVYLARDLELDRPVAVKLLRASQASMTPRFLREADAGSRVHHPHVVALYDFGLGATGPFLVFEHVPGAPLSELPDGLDPLIPMLQAASGLEELHRSGLVHRDLKPANILHHPGRGAVIIDLGICRDLAAPSQTATGMFLGTPPYSAPEVLAGARATPASDWYAWGATLYELVEGTPPMTMAEAVGIMRGEPPPPLRFARLGPDAPAARLVAACMARDPEARPRSRSELEALLALAPGTLAGPGRTLPRPGRTARGTRTWDGADGAASDPHPRLPSSPLAAPRRAAIPRSSARAVRGALLAAGAAAGLLALVRLGNDAPSMPQDSFAEPSGAWLAGLRGDERPDPPRWPDLLEARLPQAARFLAWIAEGGRPESLPEPSRRELARIDAVLAERGLPRPFLPYLAQDPTAGPAATARRALDRALAFAAGREALYADPAAPLPPRLAEARGRVLEDSLLGLVRAAAESPEGRRELAAWLRPGSEALATAIYAIARSAAEDPATGAALEVELARQARRLGIFFYSELAWLPPETLAPAGGPVPAALRARLVQARRITAVRLGLSVEADLATREETLWRAALAPVPAPGPADRERADVALFHLLRIRPPESHPKVAAGLLAEFGPRLFEAPLPIRTKPCIGLARALLAGTPGLDLAGTHRAMVIATLLEARARPGEDQAEAAELAERLLAAPESS